MLIPHRGDRRYLGDKEVFLPIVIPEGHKVRFGHFDGKQHPNTAAFSTFLPPRFPGTEPYQMVQIGVSLGLDLVWHLQHTLKHPDSRAVGVDKWVRSPKVIQNENIYELAKDNFKYWPGKIRLIKGDSAEVLPTLPGEFYDLAMVDGNHSAVYAYNDGLQALRMVKVGGWIMFDDIRWGPRRRVVPNHNVWEGFHRLWETHGHFMKIAWDYGDVVCVEKTGTCDDIADIAKPLKLDPQAADRKRRIRAYRLKKRRAARKAKTS